MEFGFYRSSRLNRRDGTWFHRYIIIGKPIPMFCSVRAFATSASAMTDCLAPKWLNTWLQTMVAYSCSAHECGLISRRNQPTPSLGVSRQIRDILENLSIVEFKPDRQTAKTTAATASAPNKIIEHVIQLEISPFSFVCRIIACILLSVTGWGPVRSQKSMNTRR
ncbi:hypothetical protein DEV91_102399 [Phyllobacterium brassicacearum]|nr:hypothetical protein DEV91_102399 [Phyllobacterium brassicacearum]